MTKDATRDAWIRRSPIRSEVDRSAATRPRLDARGGGAVFLTGPGSMTYTGAVNLDALAAVQLRDPEDKPRVLGEYWADRSVVLVFLRHFG